MSIPNDRRALTDSERQALRDFAELKISSREFEREMREVLTIRSHDRRRTIDIHFKDASTPVVWIDKHHLERALANRRNGLISEEELSEWASILLMVDVYAIGSRDEELIVQWLNDLSYGLNET